MRKLFKHSISQALIVSLVFVILAVSSIAVFSIYIFKERESTAQLNKSADDHFKYLNDALKQPFWQINKEAVKGIGNAFAKNDLIVRLVIKDRKGAEFINITKNKAEKKDNIKRSGAIIHNEIVIGNLDITFTTEIDKIKNYEFLKYCLITLIIVIWTLIFSTGFFLKHF